MLFRSAFDVVNFSALVEADEARVLAAWRALRRAIDPLIVEGGGRLFKSLGDGLLIEFTSPVEATRTALAVQAAAGQRAAKCGADDGAEGAPRVTQRAAAACGWKCAAPSTWAR